MSLSEQQKLQSRPDTREHYLSTTACIFYYNGLYSCWIAATHESAVCLLPYFCCFHACSGMDQLAGHIYCMQLAYFSSACMLRLHLFMDLLLPWTCLHASINLHGILIAYFHWWMDLVSFFHACMQTCSFMHLLMHASTHAAAPRHLHLWCFIFL